MDKITQKHSSYKPEVPEHQGPYYVLGEVLESMKRHGGAIVRNLLTADDVAALEKDVRPYLEKDPPWQGAFFPAHTRRVTGLVGKSELYVEKVVKNSLFREVAKGVLSSTCKCYFGQDLQQGVSEPQLSSTIVFSVMPGAKAQGLHRDDIGWHAEVPDCTEADFAFKRESLITFFIAGKKTTRANGATRFLPGTHRWASDRPPPIEEKEGEVFYAELNPGDAFVMLGSCYHGGSENTTKDDERLVFSAAACKGTLRQDENQYLASSLDAVRGYDEDTRRWIGYSLSKPFLGWVEFNDPYLALTREKAKGVDMF